MSSVTCFVGLDYHQDSIRVCAMDVSGKILLDRNCGNDWQEVGNCVQRVGKVQRVGIEACCGAADFSQKLVDHYGWDVSLGHPAYIAKLKQSPDKTDWSDSRLITDLTRVGYLPGVWLAPAYIRDLRLLVNHRQSLVDQRRAAKLRIGAVLREQRVKINCPQGRWTKLWIECLKRDQQLSRSAKWIIDDLLGSIEHLNEKVVLAEVKLREATIGDEVIAKLRKQEGIGEVTAWVMRAFIGRFDRFKRSRQLSRYCGLSPANASSGRKQADAGLINGCNKVLRMTIIQAAHRLVRTSARWKKLAESMKQRGKPANVIACAVANRWVRKVHHAMKPQA